MSPSPSPSCPACGADAPDGTVFCTACGASLAAAGAPPPPPPPPPPPGTDGEPSGDGAAPPPVGAPAGGTPTRRRRLRPVLIGAAGVAAIAAAAFLILQLRGDGGRDWTATEWDTEVVEGAILGSPGDLYVAHASGKIAYHRGDDLCVVDLADSESPTCRSLDWNPSRFDASWSPDGRYLAFTEDFYRERREPDVWVWDLEEDSLTNLTDDGVEGRPGDETDVDLSPVFVSDREIAFLRLSDTGGGRLTSLWAVDVAGGDPVEVVADLVRIDEFGGSRAVPTSFPAGRDGRWHLAVADPEDPDLEILTVVVASGEVTRERVTGDITLDEGLFITADHTGRFVALNLPCLEGASRGNMCTRYVIDPADAAAVATPGLEDDRFDAETEGPFPSGGTVAVSPDGAAVAGCFSVRRTDDSGFELVNLIGVASLDDPEWTSVAEFTADDAGMCAGAPVWTDAGIAIPLLSEDRHVFLAPAG